MCVQHRRKWLHQSQNIEETCTQGKNIERTRFLGGYLKDKIIKSTHLLVSWAPTSVCKGAGLSTTPLSCIIQSRRSRPLTSPSLLWAVQGELAALTGVRALACLSIVLGHSMFALGFAWPERHLEWYVSNHLCTPMRIGVILQVLYLPLSCGSPPAIGRLKLCQPKTITVYWGGAFRHVTMRLGVRT
jgi:hypothetical protein